MAVVKGLILSLLVFVLYVGSTAVAGHVLRPRGHLRVFLLASLPCGVVYFILYTVTPWDLWFLPAGLDSLGPIIRHGVRLCRAAAQLS